VNKLGWIDEQMVSSILTLIAPLQHYTPDAPWIVDDFEVDLALVLKH
jgi:hypothetical protein